MLVLPCNRYTRPARIDSPRRDNRTSRYCCSCFGGFTINHAEAGSAPEQATRFSAELRFGCLFESSASDRARSNPAWQQLRNEAQSSLCCLRTSSAGINSARPTAVLVTSSAAFTRISSHSTFTTIFCALAPLFREQSQQSRPIHRVALAGASGNLGLRMQRRARL